MSLDPDAQRRQASEDRRQKYRQKRRKERMFGFFVLLPAMIALGWGIVALIAWFCGIGMFWAFIIFAFILALIGRILDDSFHADARPSGDRIVFEWFDR